MQKYMTARKAAALWHLSERRVQLLCKQGRIENAEKAGGVWLIPEDTAQPVDLRIHGAPQGKTAPAFHAEQLYGTNTTVRRVDASTFDTQTEDVGCVITPH